MGCTVYVRVSQSAKVAHQYVNVGGERIGEIWREQVDLVDQKGYRVKKWRWFASKPPVEAAGSAEGGLLNQLGYGTKDRAVDALELRFA